MYSSSKIPFVSSQKARSPSATPRRSSRQMSADLADPPSSRSPQPQPQPPSPSANGSLRHRKKPRTTSATSSDLAKMRKPKPPKAAVDWEIPRKTLHSSIGAFSDSDTVRFSSLSLPPAQVSSLGTSTPPTAILATSYTFSALLLLSSSLPTSFA